MISGSLNSKRRRVSGLIADSARPGATIARVKVRSSSTRAEGKETAKLKL